MSNKVVLVYSGGLDTSVCIPMMKEEYGYDEVVTVTVDVGQPEEDIREAAEKASAMGTTHFTVDAKEEFVKYLCFPSIKANGDYEGYPLSTAIARPLIALKAVEKAKEVGANAFGHGCTGKGNDQFRIEFVLSTLMPDAPIIAPMREKNMTRSEEIEYAVSRGVPIGQSKEKIWSIDENLWGRSIEGGRLEEPDYTPPEEIFRWTRSPENAPDEARVLTLDFEEGVPVAVDGERLEPVELVTTLNEIAGEHGVGRVDIMEDRMLGLKVRENYECPAAVTLLTAHKALEALVLTREELRFKALVDQEWGRLAYEGLWLHPLKEDLDAFINHTQMRVSGSVRLKLYKGSLTVQGRNSQLALYNEDLASFDSKTFDQSLSAGNVRTHGMQAKMFQQVVGLENRLQGGARTALGPALEEHGESAG